jgi:hypothetical protein
MVSTGVRQVTADLVDTPRGHYSGIDTSGRCAYDLPRKPAGDSCGVTGSSARQEVSSHQISGRTWRKAIVVEPGIAVWCHGGMADGTPHDGWQ